VALVVILVAVAGWYGWQLGPWADATRHAEPIDFANLELASSPNQYLVAPAGATPKAKPDAVSPVFAVPVDTLRDAVLAVTAEAPRFKVLDRSPDGMRMVLVQRSAILRFPDYINVEILPAGQDGSTLAVYSRSRFGYSDLGVNRARVEALLADVRRRVGG
jgi:uncharacterized protein (DUF1499 family)